MIWYVYLAHWDDGQWLNPPIKIGISSDVQARVRELQTASPFELVVKMTIAVPGRRGAQMAEKFLRDRLRPYRIRGEWYKNVPEVWAAYKELERVAADWM